MAIIHGIGAVLSALVRGIVAIFNAIINVSLQSSHDLQNKTDTLENSASAAVEQEEAVGVESGSIPPCHRHARTFDSDHYSSRAQFLIYGSSSEVHSNPPRHKWRTSDGSCVHRLDGVVTASFTR